MKKPTIEEIKNWYEEEIKRKDEIIERLRKENLILLRTALKNKEELIKQKNEEEKKEKHQQEEKKKKGINKQAKRTEARK